MSEVTIPGATPIRRQTRTYDTANSPAGLAAAIAKLLCPTGTLVPSLLPNETDGWKLCNGQFLQPNEYPTLFAAIGYTYGISGDQFGLPDLTGRSVMGAGGAPALTVGAFGGAAAVTLTVDQLPAHGHGITDTGHTHTFTATPHSHTITDPGHAHTALVGATAATGGSAVGSAAGNTGTATTGITINAATAAGLIGNATTGIVIGQTGGGDPVPVIPPVIGVHWLIRT